MGATRMGCGFVPGSADEQLGAVDICVGDEAHDLSFGIATIDSRDPIPPHGPPARHRPAVQTIVFALVLGYRRPARCHVV